MRTTAFRRKRDCLKLFFAAVLFGLLSCSEKFVVVSDANAYHVGSGKVYAIQYDTSLRTYDQFELTKEEYKELVMQRSGSGNRDSVRL